MSFRCVMTFALWTCVAPARAGDDARAGDTPADVQATLDEARSTFAAACAARHDVTKAKELFAQAADHFTTVCRASPDNVALYHDLGNACLLAGRLPEALHAYQRGLLRDPNDVALRRHLDYARAMVIYDPSGRGRPRDERWPAWLPRPTVVNLAWLALLAYGGAFLGVALGVVRRRWRWYVFGSLTFLVFVAAGYSLLKIQEPPSNPRVIIARDDLPLRQGNGPSYPAHAELPFLARGMEARRIAQRGQWLMIAFDTGETGWVPAETVLVID